MVLEKKFFVSSVLSKNLRTAGLGPVFNQSTSTLVLLWFTQVDDQSQSNQILFIDYIQEWKIKCQIS